MTVVIQLLIFALSFLLTLKGGDIFVDAALYIGKRAHIPPVIMGATLVSLTTTLPELFVSSMASASGHTDMAFGNAIGSIICNTGLVLGLCVFLKPMVMKDKSQLKKGMLLLLSLAGLAAMAATGSITKTHGLMLYALLAVYLYFNFEELRIHQQKERTGAEEGAFKLGYLALFLLGACCIVVGARLLVNSGSALAGLLGVPENVISLSLIALGTSLPELVTSLTALRKKESGLSLGNIIGANILNVSFVLSTSAMVAPSPLVLAVGTRGVPGVSQLLWLDIPVAGVMGLILLAGILQKRFTRLTGGILLGIYAGYLGCLVMLLV